VALGQNCSTLGQNPSSAFPVCGTTSFVQDNVPLCEGAPLFVPGCTDNANYANKNPFWYKFTCYEAGTLGFTITPKDLGDDYDWQLYDITGLNPDQVFTNRNIIVSGNWAGNPGATGASANGANFIQCASSPTGTEPRFAKMPELIAGHEYLLLVSHYTDSQSGYSLTFTGGTAVITDPKEPHLDKAAPNCDGKQIILKLNKKMRCNSITPTGSEFAIIPAVTTVVSAVATNCNSSFDFDEVIITLANNLPTGDYQLVMRNGSDNNTILDNCDRGIPGGEQASFSFFVPQPIPIDSVGAPGCAPGEVRLYFSRKIDCSTVAADGSNFTVTGPSPVTVQSASGSCTNGLSDIITVRFTSPIFSKGTYTVIPKLSVNGGAVRDACGLVIQPQPVSFTAADTVSALFSYTTDLGCRTDTLHFEHNGAHDVNAWNWVFNNNGNINTPAHSIIWPASGTNTVQLVVSNGVCSDTANTSITLDNEVKAGFGMPEVLCPEDALQLINTSTGLIDTWQWSYVVGTSTLETPQPILFPNNNIERDYLIKLVATNQVIGCSDSITKTIKVMDNCFIAVPSAFTPNGDGLNDYLRPNNALKATNLEFKVFNRWGEMVFQSRNWQDRWDGKIKGITQAAGVYVWFLSYTHADTGQKVFQKGTTTLLR
jgi:gliding motility-associated-like protein